MKSVQLHGVMGLKGLGSALLCVLVVSLANLSSARAEPRVGDPAPPLIVTTPSGQALDLSTLKGRVVLVNFWATWCAPCLAEMPIIEKFYAKHHAAGFEVVALSIDKPSVREKVARVLARLPFPGALLSNASRNGFGTPEFVPMSYVIDARGVVREKIEADIDAEDLNEAVLPLLKEAVVKPEAPAGRQDAGLSSIASRPGRPSSLRALVRQPEGMEGEADRLAAYIDNGNALITQGNLSEGIRAFENCKDRAEHLLEAQPENPRWLLELAFCNEGIGNIRRAISDFEGALGAYGARKRILERLSLIDPNNSNWQRELAVSHAYLAHVYWQEGDRDKARAALLSGKAIIERMAGRASGNISFQDELTWFDLVIPSMAGK